MSVSAIHNLVREGRVTPAVGAKLLELRRMVQAQQRPRLVRFFAWLFQ